MKSVRVVVTVIMLILIPQVAAYAADLVTPAMAAVGGQFVLCEIVNIGTDADAVEIRIMEVSELLEPRQPRH